MASSSTADKSNASFFDKACAKANQADYLVPYGLYDTDALPLTLEPISITKTKETIVYVKPVMKKLNGNGDFKDLCIMTGPSRIIFEVAPFTEKKNNDYKPLTEDIMDSFYATIKAGESKSLDLCLDVQPDLIKFCHAIDEKVKKFVQDNLHLYPNLEKIVKKNGQATFYPSVITKPSKDGKSSSSHLKAKLIFRNGEYDLRAFDSEKKPTSIRANRMRLKGGTVNALLRFGNIWSNSLGAFGASWKIIGGHFEFASPVEPASFDDLFSAYSSTYGGGKAASSSTAAGGCGGGGGGVPTTVSLKTAKALGVDVSDEDESDEDEEEAHPVEFPDTVGGKGKAVVASDDEEESEEEEDDEEEDEEDEEAAAEAKRKEEEAAEAKRKEEEAAAAAAAAAAAPKKKKATKKAAAAE